MEKVFRRTIAELKNAFAERKNITGNLELIFHKIDVKPQATDLQRLCRIQIYLLCRQYRLQREGRMSSGNYEVDADLVSVQIQVGDLVMRIARCQYPTSRVYTET